MSVQVVVHVQRCMVEFSGKAISVASLALRETMRMHIGQSIILDMWRETFHSACILHQQLVSEKFLNQMIMQLTESKVLRKETWTCRTVLQRSLLYLKKSMSMNVGDDSRKKEKDRRLIRNVLESAILGNQ